MIMTILVMIIIAIAPFDRQAETVARRLQYCDENVTARLTLPEESAGSVAEEAYVTALRAEKTDVFLKDVENGNIADAVQEALVQGDDSLFLSDMDHL